LTQQIVSITAVEWGASDVSESDAATRAQLAKAQFHRLLNSCAGALAESI